MDKEKLIKIDMCEAVEILGKGGCPANNTTCCHLRSGVCAYDKADLRKRESKYMCGSYNANIPNSRGGGVDGH